MGEVQCQDSVPFPRILKRKHLGKGRKYHVFFSLPIMSISSGMVLHLSVDTSTFVVHVCCRHLVHDDDLTDNYLPKQEKYKKY